jgi:CRP-like cAMP-binding protein
MHGGAAKDLPFFADKDRYFVCQIVPFLHAELYGDNEVIYEEEGYADQIYFIYKGRVNLVFGDQNICFKNLQKGIYFGDIEVIK